MGGPMPGITCRSRNAETRWGGGCMTTITTDAVQLLGGYGFTRDFPVERMMRDAKITQIYEGTNQICRMVAGRQVLAEGKNRR